MRLIFLCLLLISILVVLEAQRNRGLGQGARGLNGGTGLQRGGGRGLQRGGRGQGRGRGQGDLDEQGGGGQGGGRGGQGRQGGRRGGQGRQRGMRGGQGRQGGRRGGQGGQGGRRGGQGGQGGRRGGQGRQGGRGGRQGGRGGRQGGRGGRRGRSVDMPVSFNDTVLCRYYKNESVISCSSMTSHVECQAGLNISAFQPQKFNIFGIAKMPLFNYSRFSQQNFPFSLIPRSIANSSVWLRNSMEVSGRNLSLQFFYGEKNMWNGIRVFDQDCFSYLSDMFSSVRKIISVPVDGIMERTWNIIGLIDFDM